MLIIYYEPIFNDVFSRNNLPRIKDGTYAINRVDENSQRTHCVSLHIDRNSAVHTHYFGIEYIPQEVLNKINDKSITQNVFRKQNNKSTMCGFYYIAVIECLLGKKNLLNYTKRFSSAWI